MLLPQELMAEQLWLLWDETHGVMPLNKIEELLYRCNLKLRKGKTLTDVRLSVGRGFNNTFGDMKLARHQIADEIDKVCIIARWDFAVGRYKEKIKVYFTKVKKEQRFQRLPNNENRYSDSQTRRLTNFYYTNSLDLVNQKFPCICTLKTE